MSTIKKLTLSQFIARYSETNRTEYEVLQAAVDKLDPKSSAHQSAIQCMAHWREFEEYLESAGFEL